MPSPAVNNDDDGPTTPVVLQDHPTRPGVAVSPLLLPSICTLLSQSLAQQQPISEQDHTRAAVMDISMITHATNQDPLQKPLVKQTSQNMRNNQRITKRYGRGRKDTSSSHCNTNSSSSSSKSISSTSTSSSSATTNPSPSRTTSTTRLIRPRWQPQERLKLLLAVVEDKRLDDMATFHWGSVALKVGRSRKACKDQWRREIFRSIIDHFTILANNSSENDEDNDDDG